MIDVCRRTAARVALATGLWLVLATVGCAQAKNLVRQEMCSRDAAYAAGVSDGKAGRDEASNFAWGCPMPDGLDESYRDGYAFGVAEARRAAPAR